MIFDKFVKITKSDWSQIKKDYNSMIQEIKDQKAISKRQSKELEKLLKYKENDDLLFSYENSIKDQRNSIKTLEDELEQAKAEIISIKKQLDTEKMINDLIADKLVSEYRNANLKTVSLMDIKV